MAIASWRVRARPSCSAPPMMASRCPPTYSAQAIGGPEVRMVSRVMRGTTSMAGLISISTGSVRVSRSYAVWLAVLVTIAASEESDPTLALEVADLIVKLGPFHPLFLEVSLLEARAEDLVGERVVVELVKGLQQGARKDIDVPFLELLVGRQVEVVVRRRPGIQPFVDPLEPGGDGKGRREVQVARNVGGSVLQARPVPRQPKHRGAVVGPIRDENRRPGDVRHQASRDQALVGVRQRAAEGGQRLRVFEDARGERQRKLRELEAVRSFWIDEKILSVGVRDAHVEVSP